MARTRRRYRPMLARWRRLYGASPLQLIALVASLTLTAYAASKLLSGGHVVNVVAWFTLAIAGHDLVLFPLYAALNFVAGRATSGRAPNTINFLRAPAFISGLLLLVYFPSILGLNSANYRADTSLNGSVYLSRWLLISAALFLIAGFAGALEARRHRPARNRQPH